MQHIDRKLDRIHDKLDSKSDKTDVDKLDDRVGDVESKTERLAIKQAGIAASMSAVSIWIKSQFFS